MHYEICKYSTIQSYKYEFNILSPSLSLFHSYTLINIPVGFVNEFLRGHVYISQLYKHSSLLYAEAHTVQ